LHVSYSLVSVNNTQENEDENKVNEEEKKMINDRY